jgi:hypothetical protein
MAKRELIDTGTDKRYVRRDERGSFKESTDTGRSLAADVRQKAKTVSKPGQGDKGDRARATSSLAQKPVTKRGRVTASQADKAVRSYMSERKK